ALGEIYGATKMLKVSSVHVSGVSYKNIGVPGLDLLEDLASQGAKVQPYVKATLNPAGMDQEKWRLMGVPESFAEKQLQVYEAFKRMGVGGGLTCTPYEAGNRPGTGESVAWAESSAVAYANSVLGVRTNRESGITALASAVTGRTPNYGFHLEENRKPTLLVEVEARLKDVLDFGGLGYLVGLNHGNAVPYFRGVKTGGLEEFKALGSAMASSGAVALYHVENLTPEAPKYRKEIEDVEKAKVSEEMIRKVFERFPLNGESFDCIFLGCPHCSLGKLRRIAEMVKGKRVKGRLWICTSRRTYSEALKLGLVEILEGAGILVLKDTCMVVAPLKEMGVETVLADSFKAVHYLSGSLEASLASTKRCVEIAVKGRVKP
ncbi:MAG: hypothetical protein AYL30_004230, partial [Candidatus Hecatellales archaeon B24]